MVPLPSKRANDDGVESRAPFSVTMFSLRSSRHTTLTPLERAPAHSSLRRHRVEVLALGEPKVRDLARRRWIE